MTLSVAAFLILWCLGALAMFIIIPAELQLRQGRTASVPWAGIAVRRTTLAEKYDTVRCVAHLDTALFATDFDKDRFVVSGRIIRGIIGHNKRRGDVDIVFRFPFGLAMLFTIVPIASLTLAFEFPVHDVQDWFGVAFFICFMSGLPIGMWVLLHRLAIQEVNDISNRLSGNAEPFRTGGAPDDVREPPS